MSAALNISLLLAEKAQAHLIAYDTKFMNARANAGTQANYLKAYTYSPPINPGVNIVRMPIPLSAPEMKIFKGRRHYRQNSTAFIDLTAIPYDDGVEEDADKMAAFDWTGFSSTPEAISTVIDAWPAKHAAALLNDQSYTDWTGGKFLAATKYANPFKKSTSTTFKTYWAGTTLNTTNVQLMIADMVSRRGFNDLSLGFGVKNLTLFSSNALFPTALSVTKDLTIPGNVTNPIVKFNMNAEAWPDLAANRWGILQGDGATMSTHPVFGSLRGQEIVLVSGMGSPKYHLENKMGHNVKVYMGVGLVRYESISVAAE